MITNTVVYSNEQMLAWVSYMSQNVEFNVEKVKLMNVCHKKKNVIPSVESNKRVLIFADETHTNLCYDMWKAGLGDCEVWYETGLTPQNNCGNCRDDAFLSHRQRHYGANCFTGH